MKVGAIGSHRKRLFPGLRTWHEARNGDASDEEEHNRLLAARSWYTRQVWDNICCGTCLYPLRAFLPSSQREEGDLHHA
jgi:hypothetical protein